MLFRIATAFLAAGSPMLMIPFAYAQPYYPYQYGPGYGPPARNRPYIEERSATYGPYGPRTTKRFVEDDPRGGKVVREEWRDERGRKTTRRTFIDPYGNQRVVVDHY